MKKNLDKWRTKEDMAGLINIYSRWTVSESGVLKKRKKKASKSWHRTWEMHERNQMKNTLFIPKGNDVFLPLSWSIFCLARNGLRGRVAVEINSQEREKSLRYDKWHKTRTEDVETGRTSTIFKQYGIMLTEKGTKGIQHPWKSFGLSFGKPGELFLKPI